MQKIGLTDGHQKLNLTKVTSLNQLNYTTVKPVLGIRNDFQVIFTDKHGNVLNIGSCGFGKYSLTNITDKICENLSLEAKHIAKTERFVYYDRLIKMQVLSFRK